MQSDTGAFVGIVHRRFRLAALRERLFVRSPAVANSSSARRLSDAETIRLLRATRASDEAVLDVASRVSSADTDVFDVSSLCHEHPLTVHDKTSILECFEVFRSMGLRHLVILDDQHRVSDTATRRNFVNAIHVIEHELEHMHALHKHKPT